MAAATAKVRLVCVSDTHNAAPGGAFQLPRGDVLIHAGDLTNQGSFSELEKATSWLAKADFALKIVVAGNHDLSLDSKYGLSHKEGWSVIPAAEAIEACRNLMNSVPGLVYLQHTGAVVHVPGKDVSFRVFGSPYSPDRGRQNWAFQYGDVEAQALWDAIPADVDVLITHTPPAGYCDASLHWQQGGCTALTQALTRLRPRLHICGHAHEGRGVRIVDWESASCGDAEEAWSWRDPGMDNKKQSLLDLTGSRGEPALRAGVETAVVNAAVTARSFGHGHKTFNKPIVVDLLMPTRHAREDRVGLVPASGSDPTDHSTVGSLP